MPHHSPHQIGQYALLSPLGQGGMGEVWRCRHELLGRQGAMKVIRPDALGTTTDAAALIERFKREARAMSALESPHTVQIFDFGVTGDGTFYYVMELLEGCSLKALVDRSGPIDARRAIALLRQACASLAEAHHRGLVHRDIKPANIFCSRRAMRHDFVKVLDFGLVKIRAQQDVQLTAAGSAEGTPAYMPPEIIGGSASLDALSDVYSLGCVAYFMLTGALVFEGQTPMELVMAHVRDTPTPPSALSELPIPDDLEQVILQCLAKAPGGRPQSAQALDAALAGCKVPAWSEADAASWWRAHRPEQWGVDDAPEMPGLQALLDGAPPLPDKPSIVVLPFVDRGDSKDRAYFADGITDDIITDLSKASGLLVIARNSAFAFRESGETRQEICKRLGVRYALEGSVRHAGGRVRVTAALIDGQTEVQVWAERFDRDLTDIFAVQDELTLKIVRALEVTLDPEEAVRLHSKGTSSIEAYEAFVRGRHAHMLWTREGNAEALTHFAAAIELDPKFTEAYSTTVVCHLSDFLNEWTEDPPATLAQAQRFADLAMAFDDRHPASLVASGILLTFRRQLDAAIEQARTAIELDPNLTAAYILLGNALHYAGRNQESLDALMVVLRLDPIHPIACLYFMAQAYFALERWDRTVELLERRIELNAETDIARVLLASCFGHLGRFDEAREQWRLALEFNPAYDLERRRQMLPYADPAGFEPVIEGLAKAGLPSV